MLKFTKRKKKKKRTQNMTFVSLRYIQFVNNNNHNWFIKSK